MTEKQASSEIAQSRSRFEKFGRQVFLYDDGDLRRDDIGNYRHQEVQSAWFSWQAAERDTRERCAQLAIQFAKDWRPCTCGFDDGKNYKTECGHAINCSMYHAINLAERIRGKE